MLALERAVALVRAEVREQTAVLGLVREPEEGVAEQSWAAVQGLALVLVAVRVSARGQALVRGLRSGFERALRAYERLARGDLRRDP